MAINRAVSALDILLILVQINVAIGMLYVGLPAARYRNKLRANMLRELRLQRDAFSDTDVSWEIYGNCLRQKDFQKAHNYLSM